MVRERMLTGLREAGFSDLVPAHLDVLQYPGPENQRPSELAAQTRMTRQAMNYLRGQLEQFGYLTRDDDPDDQRSKRVHLTDRGDAAARTIREIVRRVEADWEQQVGPERFTQLRKTLIELVGIAARGVTRTGRHAARRYRVRTLLTGGRSIRESERSPRIALQGAAA